MPERVEDENEEFMNLSYGTFDNDINFAENALQEMEEKVNLAINQL